MDSSACGFVYIQQVSQTKLSRPFQKLSFIVFVMAILSCWTIHQICTCCMPSRVTASAMSCQIPGHQELLLERRHCCCCVALCRPIQQHWLLWDGLSCRTGEIV